MEQRQAPEAWMDQEYLASSTAKTKSLSPPEISKQTKFKKYNGANNDENDEDDGDKNSDDKKVFGIVIRNCPKSLKLLLQFYRIFGYSFSGLCFEDGDDAVAVADEKASEVDSEKTTTTTTEKDQSHPKIAPNSFFWRNQQKKITTVYCTAFLLYHMALITGAIFTIYISQTANVLPQTSSSSKNSSQHSNSSSSSFFSAQHNISSVIEYEIKLGIQQFRHGFDDFKPILRTILQSTVRVFMFSALANFVLNLFTGGRLIREIVRVRTVVNFDHFSDEDEEEIGGGGRAMAIKTILALLVSILGVNIFSLVLFNRAVFNSVLALLFRISFSSSPVSTATGEEEFIAKQVLLLMVFHMLLYVVEMMVTLLFGYTMIMFKRHLEMLQRQVRTMKMDETDLYTLKRKLTTLSSHFKTILSYFSWPLTIVQTANIYLVISSACYLMISQGKLKFFSCFIFNFGLFGFTRLILVCCAGNLPHTAYQELIREIYENVPEWSLPLWLSFIEVKRLREKFAAEIFSAFSISQSAILSTLGFALSYIVVLLQTENYGTANDYNGGVEVNSTLLSSTEH